MIRVTRPDPPAYLESAAVRTFFDEMSAYYQRPPYERGQTRHQFIETHPSVIEALRQTFHNKCAYCDTHVEIASVDLFRPRSNATGHDGTSPDHYWWLAFEWRNLYLSCTECSKSKGSAFPVAGPRAAPGTAYESLRREKPLLLDPCSDQPEMELFYDDRGRIVGSTERALTSIDLLDLNRRPLVDQRKRIIDELFALWRAQQAVDRDGTRAVRSPLADQLKPELSCAGLRRQYIRTWAETPGTTLGEDPVVRDFLSGSAPAVTAARLRLVIREHDEYMLEKENASLEDEVFDTRLHLKTRFLLSIELHNVRSIEHIFIPCGVSHESKAGCLTLLGENGAGKSTVLQSIALALMGRRERKRLGLRPRHFLRDGAYEGFVRVQVTGSPPIEVRFRRGQKEFDDNSRGPKVATLGYGATRLMPRRRTAAPRGRATRVESLFNAKTALTEPGTWLQDLEPEAFRVAATDLKKLLWLRSEDTIRRGPPTAVKAFGHELPLSSLSSGYQTILAIAVDVMAFERRLRGQRQQGEYAREARGIVLIDEIDAHLHPRWKMRVVSDLRDMFPQLQFVFTTHDPLCLRGLDAGEVVVMERLSDDRIVALTDLPSPRAMRVDQLLTSEFFGLNSTLDAETERLISEYQALLVERHRTGGTSDRLAVLEAILDERHLLGSDPRERLLLQAADRYLGERRALDQPARREADKAVEATLTELWDRRRRAP